MRGRMPKGKNEKLNKKSLLELAGYCKPYLAVLVIAILGALISAILSLLGPDKLSEMTNVIGEGMMMGIDMERVHDIGLLLVIFYGVSLILSILQGQITARVTQRITQKLRSELSTKMNRLPMWYFSKASTGDVLSRVTNDVDTIGQALNQSMGNLVSSVCLLLGSFIMMLKTDVVLTITAVVATGFGFVLMGVIMGKSQQYFLRQQEYLGKLNGHIEEVFSSQSIVKVYNAEDKMGKMFYEMNEELKKSALKAQFLSGLMMPLMMFIGNFGYVAVCIVGAMLVLEGSISLGVIVAFIMYIRYFTQPLGQIAQAVQSLQSASAASERVFEFLKAEEMPDETHKRAQLEKVEGNVTFKNVHFAYEGTKRVVIKDFSAEIKAGQKIAIVGPTGAGKTTLINLLMRYNEMQSGNIFIEETSIHDIPKSVLRDQFCMVLQDTWLFEGSIRENLIYNNEGVQDKEIEEACKAVGLHHFIQTLAKGYDTILNDKINLSAGQKQQLTIARAMIKDAPMLILDEATSSVDTRTELVIQKAMDQLMQNRTSFVIAHRLSTIRNADVILVLKDGDILESGNHEELMSRQGFYADLYNSQFEKTV